LAIDRYRESIRKRKTPNNPASPYRAVGFARSATLKTDKCHFLKEKAQHFSHGELWSYRVT